MENFLTALNYVFLILVIAHLLSFPKVLKKAGYGAINIINPFIWFDLAGLSRAGLLCMFIPFLNLGVGLYAFFRIAIRFGIPKKRAVLLASTIFCLFPYIAINDLDYL